MIVEKMQENGNFEEYSIDGTILRLGDKEMDIDALQKEGQEIIDIMEDGRFVANVIIPPAKYEEVEVAESTVEGELSTQAVRISVDMNTVKLILWDRPILTTKGE